MVDRLVECCDLVLCYCWFISLPISCDFLEAWDKTWEARLGEGVVETDNGERGTNIDLFTN